ncbi:hypothetical protein [Myxococcus sp. CA039A]|nr:hypothetical protein [Myxococcus sp. CA039A]NTX52073.1 hypothetical protein [Myxococcus sp. CA039A]
MTEATSKGALTAVLVGAATGSAGGRERQPIQARSATPRQRRRAPLDA